MSADRAPAPPADAAGALLSDWSRESVLACMRTLINARETAANVKATILKLGCEIEGHTRPRPSEEPAHDGDAALRAVAEALAAVARGEESDDGAAPTGSEDP